MVPCEGVHDPHRERWLSTQATLVGRASPPRWARESAAARSARSASLGRVRRSLAASLATIVATHSCSWRRVKPAGMSTIVRPSSR